MAPVTNIFATTIASTTRRPDAMAAAMAEANVQPVPCVFRDGSRSLLTQNVRPR